MAATKISQLTAATTVAANDLLVVVSDPSGSPATKKITYTNFYSNVVVTAKFSNTLTMTANVVSNSNFTANNLFITYRTTPASSGDSVTTGKLWFDNTYIYVATTTNTIKRVQLQSF